MKKRQQLVIVRFFDSLPSLFSFFSPFFNYNISHLIPNPNLILYPIDLTCPIGYDRVPPVILTSLYFPLLEG